MDERRISKEKGLIKNKKDRFAFEYVKHGNSVEAAQTAGYVGKNLKRTGFRLVRDPYVAERIAVYELQKKELAERKLNYTQESVMKETDAAIALAVKTENANAFVRAIEVRARVCGLWVEKHQVQTTPFHLAVSMVPPPLKSVAALPLASEDTLQILPPGEMKSE